MKPVKKVAEKRRGLDGKFRPDAAARGLIIAAARRMGAPADWQPDNCRWPEEKDD